MLWVLSGPSTVDSGGAGDTGVPPEFGGSEKGQSLISDYPSLAITTTTTNNTGFKKLSMALGPASTTETPDLFIYPAKYGG